MNKEFESENGSDFNILEFLRDQSLLGLIFDGPELEVVLERSEICEFAAGVTIADEGDAPCDLFIPLRGDLAVGSQSSDSVNYEQGGIASGRSFNLYSLLRELPFQYSLTAKSNCRVIRVPWSVVADKLSEQSILKTYLHRMTENSNYQYLGRDLTSAGCSADFRISLIGFIQERKVSRQSWLAIQGHNVTESVFVIHGDISAISQVGSGSKLISGRWNVPHRVWLNWDVLAGEEIALHAFSMRSLTEVQYYSLSQGDLNSLRAKHPSDFAIWTAWVSKAHVGQEKLNANVPEQDVDLDSFLKDSNYKRKPWQLFPWVQQNDQMDCGAACLTMISHFYGKKLPIQYWRTKLSIGRSGTSMFDLSKTAERSGLLSLALASDSVDDIPTNTYPVIVLRKYHYLVLYGKKKSHFIVGDPAIGIRKVSKNWIEDGFEQAYLVLRPTSEFLETKTTEAGGNQFWSMLKTFKVEIGLALICSLLLVMVSVVPPIVTQNLFDDVLTTKDLSLFNYCMMTLFGCTIFNAVMTWTRAYFLQFVAVKLDFLAKTSFMQRLMNLPYGFFATRHVGDFTRRLHEFQTVRSFITEKSLSFALSFVSLSIYLAVLFFYSFKIGFIALAIAPVFVVVSMLFTRSMIAAYSHYFSAQSDEDGFVADLIRGMLTIKTNGAELPMRRRLEENMVKALGERYRFHLSSVALSGVVSVIYEISKFVLLGSAVWLALRGELSAGQVIAISMLAGEVLSPFQKMALHWADFQEAKLILSRLNDVYLAPVEMNQGQAIGQRLTTLRGEIEFRDVWFRYGGDASDWVLKGVSFTIPASEKVAICGPSGSGKSTIAMLIARVYTATSGQILIDGKDVRDYDIGWLRDRIGYVAQEADLFSGTVAQNIALAGERCDYDSLVHAATLADASEFIAKKPLSFETFIPAGGHGFSGGEKQRLALARVLHRNPTLLVLDESTSALDGLSERTFIKRVNEWGRTRTIVSIAHRYSTVCRSNVVILMFDGRVKAIGSPVMLSRTDGLFQEMFETDLRHSMTEAPKKDVA